MDILNFRVAPDSNSLELWVEVPDGINYEDVEIDKIAIIDYSRYQDDHTYPDAASPFWLEFDSTNPIDTGLGIPTNQDGKRKRFVKRIPIRGQKSRRLLGIERSGMYYVYILTKGEPTEDTPCCCFKRLTVGCAVNHYPIYNQILKIINAYTDRCMIAEDKVLDLYLKKQMITQAIEVSDYVTANKIFADVYEREISKEYCYDGCGSFKKRSNAGRIHSMQGNRRTGCINCG